MNEYLVVPKPGYQLIAIEGYDQKFGEIKFKSMSEQYS